MLWCDVFVLVYVVVMWCGCLFCGSTTSHPGGMAYAMVHPLPPSVSQLPIRMYVAG